MFIYRPMQPIDAITIALITICGLAIFFFTAIIPILDAFGIDWFAFFDHFWPPPADNVLNHDLIELGLLGPLESHPLLRLRESSGGNTQVD